MTDDLVKRLREDQPVTQDMESTIQCALQDEAADRIEALEIEAESAHMIIASERGEVMALRKKVETLQAERCVEIKDWVIAGKAAGKYGVRYQTNGRLEEFIAEATTTRPASEVRAEAHAAAVEAAKGEFDGWNGVPVQMTYDEAREALRALHTDASRAAIERIKREARNEVLNGVAKALSHAGNEGAASIVTALIEKEGV